MLFILSFRGVLFVVTGKTFGIFVAFCLVFLRCFVWCFCGVLFGVFAVNHNDSVYFAILIFLDMFWARVANGSCPSGASTLPNRGKHVTHVGQAPCPF